MLHGELVLFQHGRPTMKESGSCAHRLKPLQCVVVGVDFEQLGHHVGAEFCDSPDDGEALQLRGRVGFLRLVEGA